MIDPTDSNAPPMARLLAVMAKLRDPVSGCPWDVEQDFATIAPYTIEEAYEVADAIAKNDMTALREELGDLLFQVVFHARMAEEEKRFAFDDVARDLADKMIRRHPHVFAKREDKTAEEQTEAWEATKAHERKAKAQSGALDGVPLALPAALRAQKLQKRASRVGFDWGTAGAALDKVEEEVEELRVELAIADQKKLEEEVGDVLFAMVNVARLAGVDAETALRGANAKFERRFRRVEEKLYDKGRTPAESDLAEMDKLWDEAKKEERA
jgi:tetrapyrrole methylase family protein/MazG family protein/ATP diphosphatase